jgi:hypothetical protein
MKGKILSAALWLIVCVIVSAIVVASLDVGFGHRIVDFHQASEGNSTLRSLALALSSRKEATQSFRGSPSEEDPHEDRLNPLIAEMDCYLDRIATHVSCFSSLVHTEEEAVTLFTSLIDELQAALPSDSWIEARKEPGLAPWIRSYTYADQNSYALIDIGIIAERGQAEQTSTSFRCSRGQVTNYRATDASWWTRISDPDRRNFSSDKTFWR